MPPPAHLRLTFEGIFGTVLAPVEEWSFRLNLALIRPTAPNTDFLDSAQAAFTTHLGPKIKPTARLQRIKLADIDATGFYNGAAQLKEVDVPGTAGTTNAYPLQVAVAATLLTSRRGPTGRGRIFLPAPGMSNLGALDGTMAVSDAQSYATAVAAFLGAINAPSGYGNVVVASSKGYLTEVTGVKVGRVPDVIRSRRTKIPESYGATLPVAG